MYLFSSLTRRPAPPSRRAMARRLAVEILETRDLLSVNVQSVFRGITGTAAIEPPDTIAAVGPEVLVEMVNQTLTYYDKNSGARLFQQDIGAFFGPLRGVLSLSDPVVVYDELAGRFAVGMLDFNFTNRSRFDFAVSKDSNPLDGFTFMRYDMNDGVGGFDFADYPRMGYNADAYAISFNMFPQLASGHVDTLVIEKSTLIGHRVVVPGESTNFTMAPATMHDAQPGDPMWFTESSSPSGGNTIGVVKMTNVLSDTPTYAITQVAVPDYFYIGLEFNPFYPFNPSFLFPNYAAQPFSDNRIRTDDDRIFNSSMRFGQMVAAHAVGTVDDSGIVTHVRWYQFDVTGDAPILIQMGEIGGGSGNFTYYPSIEINTLGDLGMTYMQSSDKEYMSMYVTGRKNTDPPNTMQPGVLAFAGRGVYLGGRAGDYSATTVDPVDGITFWSVNEYKPQDAFWGTGIASFSVSSPGPSGGASPALHPSAVFPSTNLPEAGLPLSILPRSTSTVSALGLVDRALIDGFFDTNRERKQQMASSQELDRAPLLKAQRADFHPWDRGLPQWETP